MTIFQRAKKLWQLTDTFEGVVTPNGSDTPKQSEPFVVFQCAECQQDITLTEWIYPGQVAVINCSNCHTSMSVYNPRLRITRTKDLPDDVGKGIWNILSTEASNGVQ